MKSFWAICMAVLGISFVTPAIGANKTSVEGNMARDGYVVIDIHWVVDTAKYPGGTKESVYRSVYEDIWHDVLPKLASKVGSAASCAGTFSKLSEGKKLIKQRPDGSKVYDYSARIRFDCAVSGRARPQKGEGPSYETIDKGYHDGFTREADAF